jgi:UDP-N-acetylmuramate-alanine ligase
VTAGRELLAVAGTHGKTTTSAMLAVALKSLGPHEPRALVGADVPQFTERLGAAVGAPASPHFVLEADEYDGAFLQVTLHTLALKVSLATPRQHTLHNTHLSYMQLLPRRQHPGPHPLHEG